MQDVGLIPSNCWMRSPPLAGERLAVVARR